MNDYDSEQGFESYLLGRGLSTTTTVAYKRGVRLLLVWMQTERLCLDELGYRDLLAWLGTLVGSAKTRSQCLTAARHYLAWQVETGRLVRNVADGIYVRGVRRRLPHDLLSAEQLAELYQSYPTGSAVQQRNKAMLGLLCFQGLTTRELARLEEADMDLEGGLVTVPGSRTSESRMLWLEATQVLALHIYLAEARSALLTATGKQTNRLFLSSGSGHRLQNVLALLMRELRACHAWFRNAKQLRASRIVQWLGQYGLREVQYMAGHRYVSSTERYRAADLDTLHEALVQHHPLSQVARSSFSFFDKWCGLTGCHENAHAHVLKLGQPKRNPLEVAQVVIQTLGHRVGDALRSVGHYR